MKAARLVREGIRRLLEIPFQIFADKKHKSTIEK